MLKQGGLLVLDAPNIALIGGDDILEEWFIDKHLYHFSKRTLARMIEAAGFTIVAAARSQRSHQSSFRRPQERRACERDIAADPAEVARAAAR